MPWGPARRPRASWHPDPLWPWWPASPARRWAPRSRVMLMIRPGRPARSALPPKAGTARGRGQIAVQQRLDPIWRELPHVSPVSHAGVVHQDIAVSKLAPGSPSRLAGACSALDRSNATGCNAALLLQRFACSRGRCGQLTRMQQHGGPRLRQPSHHRELPGPPTAAVTSHAARVKSKARIMPEVRETLGRFF